MTLDFIINQRCTSHGEVFVIIPTNTAALNWMFAHVTSGERRKTCAHLNHDRLAVFKSDANIAQLTFMEPKSK